jgi:hypothetical protein
MRLQAGSRYPLPKSGALADTLLVLAGPTGKLGNLSELQSAREEFREFASAWRRDKLGFTLDITLPREARVEARVYSASGKRIAEVFSGPLPMGMHSFPVILQSKPGMAFLRVTAQGDGLQESRSYLANW